MFTLQKSPDRDFVILNLTDTHFGTGGDFDSDTVEKVLRYTVRSLVDRVDPDLITISGDLADEKNIDSYRIFSDYINSFGIPWAPILGNHDNRIKDKQKLAKIFAAFDKCLFEAGPACLGCGNYVVSIAEGNRLLSAVIMMDSHDESLITLNDRERYVWDELNEYQLKWYTEQIDKLKKRGVHDTAIIVHIPTFAYKEAYEAAWRKEFAADEMTPEETGTKPVWEHGYEDSFGINYEPYCCCYPTDNGLLELICSLCSTKHVICGHEHVNNASIRYRGVRLTYATTTGCGGSFDPRMNGGTVLTVGKYGTLDIHHEYIDVPGIVKKL